MDGWLVKYFKPSDTSSPLPPFISHQPVPILYTMQKILSRNSDGNSTPGVFEGIKAHGSIYRPVCACECVFRYHNSKIALSEGAPTSRKAQTALSLMDVCLITERWLHKTHNQVSVCSQGNDGTTEVSQRH